MDYEQTNKETYGDILAIKRGDDPNGEALARLSAHRAFSRRAIFDDRRWFHLEASGALHTQTEEGCLAPWDYDNTSAQWNKLRGPALLEAIDTIPPELVKSPDGPYRNSGHEYNLYTWVHNEMRKAVEHSLLDGETLAEWQERSFVGKRDNRKYEDREHKTKGGEQRHKDRQRRYKHEEPDPIIVKSTRTKADGTVAQEQTEVEHKRDDDWEDRERQLTVFTRTAEDGDPWDTAAAQLYLDWQRQEARKYGRYKRRAPTPLDWKALSELGIKLAYATARSDCTDRELVLLNAERSKSGKSFAVGEVGRLAEELNVSQPQVRREYKALMQRLAEPIGALIVKLLSN